MCIVCNILLKCAKHQPKQISISKYLESLETEPASIFDIGFQYTFWNGKENILSETHCLGKCNVIYKKKKITNFWNFQKIYLYNKYCIQHF